MEAASIAADGHARARSPLEAARAWLGKYALIVVLLVLPVFYVVKDLHLSLDSSFPFLVVHGSLVSLGNVFVSGISNGAIWALVALGYTLVYGIIELINFAHGDVFMIGSFVTFGLIGSFGLSTSTGTAGIVFGLLAILVISMLTTGTLNVMIERVGYRPLRGAPKLAPLITAVGFSFILQDVGQLWLGGNPAGVPDLIQHAKNVFSVGGIHVQRQDVLAIVVTVPLVMLLTTFIARSRLGKAMRATAQDPEAARLMGINVDTTISLTFLLGGLLAGAAGLIWALYNTNVVYNQGFRAGLIAFTAAVMGGIGNLKGAVAGGFIIGIIQQLSDSRIGGDKTPIIVFAYLILIMVFKPQGLFGEETREAG